MNSMEGEDDNFKSVLWQKNMNTTVRQVVIILEASKYLQHKILEHLCYGISNIISNQKVYVQFY